MRCAHSSNSCSRPGTMSRVMTSVTELPGGFCVLRSRSMLLGLLACLRLTRLHLSLGSRLEGACSGLFTEVRGETVRKGYEQRSDRGFGWFKEGEMDGKAPLWRPAGLRCKCLRGFSDSLGSSVLGSSQPGATPK